MSVKFASYILAGVLSLIFMMDFAGRVTGETYSFVPKDNDSSEPVSEQVASIDYKQIVTELFKWSDPKATTSATTAAIKPPVTVVEPPPAPVVDPVQQMTRRVAGDPAKQVVGDHLYVLRGVFKDGNAFAVLEVTHIKTNQTNYYKALQGEAVKSFVLKKINKHSVVLTEKSGQHAQPVSITLAMFGKK